MMNPTFQGALVRALAVAIFWAVYHTSVAYDNLHLDAVDPTADVLFLGDSLFVQWPIQSPESWEYVNRGHKVQNLAERGWRTKHLLRALPLPENSADTIVLSIGGCDLNEVWPEVAVLNTSHIVDVLLSTTDADIHVFTMAPAPGRDVEWDRFNYLLTSLWTAENANPRVTVVVWPTETTTFDGRHPDDVSYKRLVGWTPLE